MRKTYPNSEMIQVHEGLNHWIWVVYDAEGEQVATGTASTNARAMTQAQGFLTHRRPRLAVALVALAAVLIAFGMNLLYGP